MTGQVLRQAFIQPFPPSSEVGVIPTYLEGTEEEKNIVFKITDLIGDREGT